MPLVRFQLRNEYGLGKSELYGEASREDPKAVLDGVAVAGLVGILRQLGDLAEFSAEVFHGLQEQVTTTASRSHNLMGRVQRIEAALPPLEKRVLAQTSHIHFAYTAGFDWHARIRNEQHHFIDNDLPQFIMDSYEECHDPPSLQLLDKFDTGGPGSCLRRYSDPTFFRRVSMRIDESNAVKIRRDKKSYRIKKKRSFPRNGEFSRGTSISNRGSRLQFSSPVANERGSPTVSMEDLTFDSGMGDHLSSFDSRSGTGYIECIFSQSDNMHLDEHGSNRSLSTRLMQHEDSVDSVSRDEASSNASSVVRKKGIKSSIALTMQHEDSVASLSLEEESATVSGGMRKKGSKTSSAQHMQHEDSIGSVFRVEESAIISSSMRKKCSKTSSAQHMQQEDSIGLVSCVEETASISSSMWKKGSKTSSAQLMQHDDSVGSLSHEEETASISSSMRKKGSKTPSAQLMQHEDSVGSLSHEEETASISSSMRKKGSKASSIQQVQCEDSIGSVSHVEKSTSISSSKRKKGSKTSSAQLMQHEDSVGSPSHEEETASISSSMRKKGSKASSIQQMQHEDSVNSLSHEEESAIISSSIKRKGSKASSTQPMQHEDSVGSVFQGKESTAISISSHSPPRIASSLSSVTWEQKTETTDLNEPNICRDQTSESVFSHFNVGGQEEVVIATKVNELDMQCNSPNMSKKLSSNEDHTNDNDSEVDHYVDALNTIESESETDLDCQTKREMEHCLTSAKDAEIRVAVEELTSHNVDEQPSTMGSGAASDVCFCKGMPLDLPEAAPEISAKEQSQVLGTSADSDCLPGISVCQNYVLDGSKVETALHDPSSLGSLPPQAEIRTSSSAMHLESPVKLVGVDFWTNGGLLGLQPAKPPVFSPSDTANMNPNLSIPTSIRKGDDDGDELLVREDDEDSFSSKMITPVSSSSDPGTVIEKSCHSNHGNTNGHGVSSITVVAPGSAVPVAPIAKVEAAETTKENEEDSSGVFGLGHRLFMSSFRKKLSLVYEEKPDLPTSDISAIDGQRESSHQKVAERIYMDQFETLSPVNSFPPSPPLEHMKISFHPVNDFAASKLGLRFSDEGNYREKVSDMFASFQLVPQPAVQLHEPGSDSEDDVDNDTFCQSSPSISDDCLSNRSESNSDTWESDSRDAFSRLSVEPPSAPTSYRNCVGEAERLPPDNKVGPAHSFPECVSRPGLSLPSFNSIRSLSNEEKNDEPGLMNSDLSVHSTGKSTPSPPPLPPAEWRFMKPNADEAKDEQKASEGLNNATFSNHLVSHIQQQPRLSPSRPQNIIEEIVQVSRERKNQQTSNVNKESFPQGGGGKTPDDKEDFLRQIRTKSFNLRRTVPPMPAAPTQAATANVKVTAILQKANAIRQVVGSDDGEDDSWSDT